MEGSVFKIHRKSNGDYYAALSAKNGQIIATTAPSKAEASVLNTIASIQLNVKIAKIIRYNEN